MAYGNEEFSIILDEIRKKVTTKEIAKKHYMSEKTIRKLLAGNGYKYDKKQELWYSPSQKRGIDIMNNCDVEEEIEELSKCRYYDRYADPYPGEEIEETEKIYIHRGLYEEVEELSEEYGCSSSDELIELILLRFLDTNRKKDFNTIFRKRYFLEHGYNKEEVKILMKYNDEDHTPAIADELFWEDDTIEEVKELKEFYKRELEKNNIDVSNENEFSYLKEKYDEMTGNNYLVELGKKHEKKYWERVEKCLNEKKQEGKPYDKEDLETIEELKKYKSTHGGV